MKVPTSFELLGTTITVQEVPQDDLDENVAEWDWDTATISLSDELTEDHELHSFLHEFCHAAFGACGREDLSQDEQLVDMFAGLMHQMIKTAK